jgi:hypothetical protein
MQQLKKKTIIDIPRGHDKLHSQYTQNIENVGYHYE